VSRPSVTPPCANIIVHIVVEKLVQWKPYAALHCSATACCKVYWQSPVAWHDATGSTTNTSALRQHTSCSWTSYTTATAERSSRQRHWQQSSLLPTAVITTTSYHDCHHSATTFTTTVCISPCCLTTVLVAPRWRMTAVKLSSKRTCALLELLLVIRLVQCTQSTSDAIVWSTCVQPSQWSQQTPDAYTITQNTITTSNTLQLRS
jgi:hypothetical protein